MIWKSHTNTGMKNACAVGAKFKCLFSNCAVGREHKCQWSKEDLRGFNKWQTKFGTRKSERSEFNKARAKIGLLT